MLNDEDAVFPVPNEIMTKWDMVKDGKIYIEKGDKYHRIATRK